jgi:hypothetical protein
MTQRHARVIDALLTTALDIHDPGDATSSIRLLVDPHQVRVVAGGGQRMALDELHRYIGEMIQTRVSIHVPSRRLSVAESGLIAARMDAIDQATGKPITVRRSVAGRDYDAGLWVVDLGVVTSRLLREDIQYRYPVREVARLRHGISQAVARYLLGQSVDRQPIGGWVLDHLLGTLGVPAGQAMRNARRRIAAEADDLAALGIVIEGGRAWLSRD